MPLLPRRSAPLQQARAGTAVAQAPLQQALPGGPEQCLQLLAGGLQQAGVQGLGGVRLTGDMDRVGDDTHRGAFEAHAGRCTLGGRLWAQRDGPLVWAVVGGSFGVGARKYASGW